MYASATISCHWAVLMVADASNKAASANDGAAAGHRPAFMRLSSAWKVRSCWPVWSGWSHDVHWWLTKKTCRMDGSYFLILRSASIFWCGSSLESCTKSETCITHIGACISTAVSLVVRNR